MASEWPWPEFAINLPASTNIKHSEFSSSGCAVARSGKILSETTLIGIDCATDPDKVGVSFAIACDDRCVLHYADVPSRFGKTIAEFVAERLVRTRRALIAIDAPLGWPNLLGSSLATHLAGEPLAIGDANCLFRRKTDRFVKEKVKKQPLDVGADRIARTAHAALKLLSEIRKATGQTIPLSWKPSYCEAIEAIEVYPAATLKAHSLPHSRYKENGQREERKAILAGLERHIELPDDTSVMEGNADVLDAVVCALAGFNFLRGDVHGPEDEELARREGWIWFKPLGLS